MRALTTLLICLLPIGAAAQESADAGQSTGPMIVQRVHDTFVVAPDFKYSRLDDHDAFFAGGYGGVLFAEQWLIGGGGYWQTNGSHDRHLGYGGVIIGWVGGADRPIAISARTLLGWGEARLTDTVSYVTPGPFPEPHLQSQRPSTLVPHTVQVRFDQGVFVLEPQVDASFRMASWGRFNAGVGYRAISGAHHEDDRIRGATVSLSFQIGSF